MAATASTSSTAERATTSCAATLRRDRHAPRKGRERCTGRQPVHRFRRSVRRGGGHGRRRLLRPHGRSLAEGHGGHHGQQRRRRGRRVRRPRERGDPDRRVGGGRPGVPQRHPELSAGHADDHGKRRRGHAACGRRGQDLDGRRPGSGHGQRRAGRGLDLFARGREGHDHLRRLRRHAQAGPARHARVGRLREHRPERPARGPERGLPDARRAGGLERRAVGSPRVPAYGAHRLPGRLSARLDRARTRFGGVESYSLRPGRSTTVEVELPAAQVSAARRRGAQVRVRSVERGVHGPKTTQRSLPARRA